MNSQGVQWPGVEHQRLWPNVARAALALWLCAGAGGGSGGSGTGMAAQNPVPVIMVRAGDLYLGQGSQAQRLTRSGGVIRAAVSPDGRWVVYLQRARAATPAPPQPQDPLSVPDDSGLSDLWLLNLSEKRPQAVTTQPKGQAPGLGVIRGVPAWSADGRQFAWLELDNGGDVDACGPGRLAVYTLSTRQTRRWATAFTPCDERGLRQPVWSQDGTLAVGAWNRVLTLQGGQVRVKTLPADDRTHGIQAMFWSAPGTLSVFQPLKTAGDGSALELRETVWNVRSGQLSAFDREAAASPGGQVAVLPASFQPLFIDVISPLGAVRRYPSGRRGGTLYDPTWRGERTLDFTFLAGGPDDGKAESLSLDVQTGAVSNR